MFAGRHLKKRDIDNIKRMEFEVRKNPMLYKVYGEKFRKMLQEIYLQKKY